MKRDFPHYPWSIHSLDRCLQHFKVFYKDETVGIEDVMNAVKSELKGPGKLLGYRAMHKKIRQEHNLNVTWEQV